MSRTKNTQITVSNSAVLSSLFLRAGFTLTELIVTITILAILWGIALLGIGEYFSSARDSVRSADIASLGKWLDIQAVRTGNYPSPDNTQLITFSGGALWSQGTIGEGVARQIGIKKVMDPKFNAEYSYSVLAPGVNKKNSYMIAGILENTQSSRNTPFISEVFALGSDDTWPYQAYVQGNYNGMAVKTSVWGACFTLALPSIILAHVPSSLDIRDAGSGSFIFQGKRNLPASYKNKIESNISFTGSAFFRDYSLPYQSDIILSTECTSFSPIAIASFSQKLRNAYMGTDFENEEKYKTLTSTLDAASQIQLGAAIINNELGGSANIASTTVLPSFACASPVPNTTTIPYSTGYNTGSPNSFDQPWVYSATPGACTFSCQSGYVWNGSSCIADQCQWDLSALNGVQNGTQSVSSTWIYSPGAPGICTYSCNTSQYTYSGSTLRCEPNDCPASTQTIGVNPNDHTYSVATMSHGASQNITSASKAIPGGNITYRQWFTCSLGTLSLSGSESSNAPSCNSGYTAQWAACNDVSAPTITSVTAWSPACNTVRFTVNGAADAGGLHATPYSFDAGSTWQAGNTKNYTSTNQTVSINQVRVRDAAGNIYMHASSVNGTSSSCAVNCSYTTYQWGSCSTTCGGGNYDTYYTKTVIESGGGTCPISEGQFAGWGGSACNTQACPANWACGGSANTCSTGSATGYNAGSCGGNQTWTCNGTNGWTNASCSTANAACIAGACNNSTNFSCSVGTSVSNVAGSCGGTATWDCNSPNGGSNASCSKANAACPVNGACNNSTNFACSAGTSASNVAGSCGGSATWSCTGLNGGTNASCSKANASCAVNGVCNNSTKFSCSAGTSVSNDPGVCNSVAQWQCQWSNGWTTSYCNYDNPVCPVAVCGEYTNQFNACSVGWLLGDGQQSACGQTRTWFCWGAWYNTVSCSKANPVCLNWTYTGNVPFCNSTSAGGSAPSGACSPAWSTTVYYTCSYDTGACPSPGTNYSCIQWQYRCQ